MEAGVCHQAFALLFWQTNAAHARATSYALKMQICKDQLVHWRVHMLEKDVLLRIYGLLETTRCRMIMKNLTACALTVVESHLVVRDSGGTDRLFCEAWRGGQQFAAQAGGLRAGLVPRIHCALAQRRSEG